MNVNTTTAFPSLDSADWSPRSCHVLVPGPWNGRAVWTTLRTSEAHSQLDRTSHAESYGPSPFNLVLVTQFHCIQIQVLRKGCHNMLILGLHKGRSHLEQVQQYLA